ncbi:MAG: ABC transporter permease, partial [Acidobacteriaceae bacterium]|nr:ABC transporter permease [Acidobacteriaceae bacterium]
GGPQAAILSHSLWQRTFASDPAIVGKPISLRGEPYTVIGVMPPAFRTDQQADLWTPLRPSRNGEGSGTNYGVIARLKPGITWAAAQAKVQALSRTLRPAGFPKEVVFEERLGPLKDIAQDTRKQILLTWSGVLLVLVIGSANVAALLIARAQARRREVAVRLAIGARRGAIVRQLLIESLLLGVTGAVAGVALGYVALEALKRLGAEQFQLWYPIALDLRVFTAMLVLALLVSIASGLLPAAAAMRVDSRSVLVENDRSSAGSRRNLLGASLVVCEVALSLVMLVSAGLLVRTLLFLDRQDPGFVPQNLLTAQTSLQDARYQTHTAVAALFDRGLEQIRRIPEVEAAGVALTLPFERPLNDGFRVLDGPHSGQGFSEVVYATPGYLETVRIPLLRGRTFRPSDKDSSQSVVIVSASFARKFFGDPNALGRHLQLGKSVAEVVGVIADVQQHSGLDSGPPVSVTPTLYVPVTQAGDEWLGVVHTWFSPSWVVRARGETGALARQMQNALRSVDPRLPMSHFYSMEYLRNDALREQRYHAVLFSSLSGLGLFLAVVGLYGIMKQSVTQRTREMGIRMALGATLRQALNAATRPGVRYLVTGLALGCLLSAACVQLLKQMLWGVQPLDPRTFAVMALFLAVCGLAATLISALQIVHLDPAQTLRQE